MKKKNLWNLFTSVAVVLWSIGMVSCDDKIIEQKIPQVEFTYSGWLYLANGQTLDITEFAINEEKSSPGIHIESVVWSFDETELCKTYSAPFSLSYPIQNQALGEHSLKAKVMVKGEGYTDTEFTVTLLVKILKEPFELHYDLHIGDEVWLNEYTPGVENGETISGYISLGEQNTVKANIIKVEYYWDNALFAATSISPYRFSYSVENQSIGNHTLTVKVYSNTEFGNFRTTSVLNVSVK